MQNKKITLLSEIGEVKRLSAELNDFFHLQDFSDGIKNNINLVLEELITNTILYGYADDEKHKIEILLTSESEYFNAEITDDAREFNPIDHPEVDLLKPIEERGIGGLGIHLVKNLVDMIKYERIDNRNVLKLKIKTN